MKQLAIFHNGVKNLMEEHPGCRWLFLTLTVRNCGIEELRQTMNDINTAWHRLQKLNGWSSRVMGCIKAIEVTIGANQTAHPHLHIIALVNEHYFEKGNYLNNKEWSALWQQALRASYMPIVDIQAVKQGGQGDAIREVIKTVGYSIKTSSLYDPSVKDWFKEYHEQTKGLRSVSVVGILKKYIKFNGIPYGKDDINLEELEWHSFDHKTKTYRITNHEKFKQRKRSNPGTLTGGKFDDICNEREIGGMLAELCRGHTDNGSQPQENA